MKAVVAITMAVGLTAANTLVTNGLEEKSSHLYAKRLHGSDAVHTDALLSSLPQWSAELAATEKDGEHSPQSSPGSAELRKRHVQRTQRLVRREPNAKTSWSMTLWRRPGRRANPTVDVRPGEVNPELLVPPKRQPGTTLPENFPKLVGGVNKDAEMHLAGKRLGPTRRTLNKISLRWGGTILKREKGSVNSVDSKPTKQTFIDHDLPGSLPPIKMIDREEEEEGKNAIEALKDAVLRKTEERDDIGKELVALESGSKLEREAIEKRYASELESLQRGIDSKKHKKDRESGRLAGELRELEDRSAKAVDGDKQVTQDMEKAIAAKKKEMDDLEDEIDQIQFDYQSNREDVVRRRNHALALHDEEVRVKVAGKRAPYDKADQDLRGLDEVLRTHPARMAATGKPGADDPSDAERLPTERQQEPKAGDKKAKKKSRISALGWTAFFSLLVILSVTFIILMTLKPGSGPNQEKRD